MDPFPGAGQSGSEFVITRHRPACVRNRTGNWQAVNLRTAFLRIIRQAGVATWPRLWQNLRSSRETELCHQHPLHVVTAWMGNSEAVAMKHYLQLTDQDFEQAVTGKSVRSSQQNGAKTGAVRPRTGPHPPAPSENKSPKPLSMHKKTVACDSMRPFILEDRGPSARFRRRLCRNTLRKTGTARISQRSENRSDPAGRPATGKADSRMARSTAVDPRLHPPADRSKSAHRTVI